MKKLKVCLGISLVIIIVLGTLLFLTLNCTFTKVNCSCKTNDYTLDTSKLETIKNGDFNTLKILSYSYGVISLSTDGKVLFDYEREISNVKNVIDMDRSADDYLYMLTKDGNIYKYYLGVTKEATLEATKVEEFKDIKRIVEYSSTKKDAGGCNYIIAIDKDNNYKVVSEYCV